jgi:hypothetical protein
MSLSQKNLVRLGAVVVGVIVLAAVVNSYSSLKSVLPEGLELGGLEQQGPLSNDSSLGGQSLAGNAHAVGGNAASSEGQRTPAPSQSYSQTLLSPEELLPKGSMGASWAAVNPASGEDLKGQNFLQSGYHSNINVIGIAQTNRNPTYDIRSEVPNPQAKVGPFLQTTIDPDPFKSTRALEGLSA